MIIKEITRSLVKRSLVWQFTLMLIFFTNILAANDEGKVEITGELKMWHKVTLTFDGPSTSETANPNPFTSYRLDVTFTKGGESYLVPGYFAADGNAANTGASEGNKWRVHFSPPASGTWEYLVSFRKGTNIHAEASPSAGESAAFMNGDKGTIRIRKSDKKGRDMRAKGWLEYVGGHYLRFKGNGEYFLKQGPDAPENLLAYADFDGDFKTDGYKDNLVKTYEPHIADWKTGDPTWAGGKGKGLIGAINYLESKGLNSFSFLTFNIDGDDQNVFPYIEYRTYDRIDVSRMDQWEIVFEHGTKKGFFLHFKTQETENETLLDNGETGVLRKLYYRELIARFSHHPALNWNLGEENGEWARYRVSLGDAQSSEQRRAMAQYFFDNDPYRKHIVMHNGQRPDDMYGNQSKLTGWSHQGNQSDFSDTYPKIKEILDKSVAAGRPWAVASDEQGRGSEGVPSDGASPISPDNTQENARKNAMWGTFMAGGWGNEWYFGYQYPHSDMNLQDFRSRDKFFNYARYALDFFKNNNIPVWEMKSAAEIVTNDNWALAKEGQVYVVYLKNGGTADLDVGSKSVNLVVKWYNPRTGGALQNGTKKRIRGSGYQNIGQAPSDQTEDWAVIVGYNKLNRRYASAQQSGELTITPKPYDRGIRNPMMGFTSQKADNIHPWASTHHVYIEWNELEDHESDGMDKILAVSNSKFANLAAQNRKAIPRVYLHWSGDERKYWPSDMTKDDYTSQQFKERVVRLIERLGIAWDNDPRIAFIEMGIFGLWGEQHGPSPTAEMQKIVGDAFAAAFKNKKVSVRHIWREFTDFPFGEYWDSWAHYDQMWRHGKGIDNINKSEDRYLHNYIGGEVAYGWGNANIQAGASPTESVAIAKHRDFVINSIRWLHCTQLRWIAAYDKNNPEAVAGAEEMQKAFGYRYVLNEVRVSMGDSLSVSFDVTNEGSAPFYYDWPIEVALLDANTLKPVWKSVMKNADIRTWHPGSGWSEPEWLQTDAWAQFHANWTSIGTTGWANPPQKNTIQEKFKVNAPKGNYVLSLAVLDPAGMLPSLRFATANYINGGRHPMALINTTNYTIQDLPQDFQFDDLFSDNSLYYEDNL